MSIDELWEGPLGGPRPWYEGARPEVRAVCDQIVAKIIELGGVEPNWSAVRRYMIDLFPGEVPTSKTALADNIRRLVTERG